ncbi:hypothetical protein [Butyrivibrio sp. YAB3001]|uniref:hypothetical protein n=1 Tax=Butyrivibrio sp. YAB3001 TaxID=1520812 RepID=UPI0008F680F3|nr:hypothetical protein [Butyrivibrio sp. YAB3001]SFD11506.1 hypothetical protein SAMN02910398_04102 [Butyrivibrio sp. YAB3001]
MLKKTDKQENLYLYDRVFSLHDPSLDGKLDFSGFHGKAEWMASIQKMYSSHMNSVFGTTAPEQAKLAFISDGTRNSGVDDKGFPKPLPDENINKYYERVKAYNVDKNNKRNRQIDDTRKLRKENEKLRERHRNDVLELKRYEKLESILKAYPDFRTLNAVLSAGERIRTIHQYYKDQDNKETVDYIGTLLKYGQLILDNMRKQEKRSSE